MKFCNLSLILWEQVSFVYKIYSSLLMTLLYKKVQFAINFAYLVYFRDLFNKQEDPEVVGMNMTMEHFYESGINIRCVFYQNLSSLLFLMMITEFVSSC